MMRTAKVTHVKLPPELLERGFWIYVWQIGLPNGGTVHYVGMTGDTGSYKAQSPFKRVTDHLGFNERGNPLRRYLTAKGAEPEKCRSLDFFAYGPIGIVPEEKERYRKERGKVAALERSLCLLLRSKDLEVLHDDPPCNFEYDERVWQMMTAAFSEHFQALRG